MATVVQLREVLQSDLPVFFENQADEDASRLAAVASRDREAFEAHWARILADPTTTIRTILFDGEVAGNVLSFERDGLRELGYWISRAFWGKGIATAAVAAFLDVDTNARCTPRSQGTTTARCASSRRAASRWSARSASTPTSGAKSSTISCTSYAERALKRQVLRARRPTGLDERDTCRPVPIRQRGPVSFFPKSGFSFSRPARRARSPRPRAACPCGRGRPRRSCRPRPCPR